MALQARQELFCLEYIKDGNATQAAIRAGYKPKYAGTNADKLLKNTNIRARIDELMAEVQQEKIADAEEVLRYLTSVIRGEATEEVAVGTPIGTEIITKHIGGREQVKAAELLAKRYGLLTENVKLSGGLPVQIVDDMEDSGDGGG
ncbi:Terminase small subunit [uncultured Anaerotruncus sp.]|uniref:Terminase small subunit n=1 Tax=uncultured Anaerotruncus sp. TaxID=905011 RepID=A0A6N2R6L1_9FIRM